MVNLAFSAIVSFIFICFRSELRAHCVGRNPSFHFVYHLKLNNKRISKENWNQTYPNHKEIGADKKEYVNYQSVDLVLFIIKTLHITNKTEQFWCCYLCVAVVVALLCMWWHNAEFGDGKLLIAFVCDKWQNEIECESNWCISVRFGKLVWNK